MRPHVARDLVEQGHGERAPFDDRLVARRKDLLEQKFLLGLQRARIDQQPAVAIFRQAGQRIEFDDFQARAFERLDQRIAHPLRELVERHQPHGRMTPHVAQRHAIQFKPRRPDRLQSVEQRGENGRGLDLLAAPRALGQEIEQRARPFQPDTAQLAQQLGTAFQPQQRIVAAHLEAHGEIGGRQLAQALGIDAQRIVLGIAAECAMGEHVEARDGKAFGALESLARRGLAVRP